LDVKKTSVDLTTQLLQVRQVLQTFVYAEVFGPS
jgi:hypothetical protein